MSVKFNALGDVYTTAVNSLHNLPDSAWCIGVWAKETTDTTGANARTVFSTGSSGQFYKVELTGPGNSTPGAVTSAGTYGTIRGDTNRGADSKWRLIIIQYEPAGNACFIYTAAVNGAARYEATVARTALVTTVIPTLGMTFGAPTASASTLNAFIGGSIWRYFKGSFNLTQAEMSRLAAGHDIVADLGKAPALYWAFETAAATLTDSRGGVVATLAGAPTTDTNPTFASSGTIAISEPFPKRVFQRTKGTTEKDIVFPVAYTGSPATIEARVVKHGTSTAVKDWTVISTAPTAAPLGAVLSLTLPAVPQGSDAANRWFNIEVRATGCTEVTDTPAKGKWGVGAAILTVGQSNMERMFSIAGTAPAASDFVSVFSGGYGVPAQPGSVGFANAAAAGVAFPIMLIRAAISGTSVLTVNDTGSGNWEATGGTTPYQKSLDIMNAMGGDVEFIAWSQGEADGGASTLNGANYLAMLRTLYGRWKTFLNRNAAQIPMGVAITGPSGNSTGTDASYSLVRRMQTQFGLTEPGAFIAISQTDMILNDTQHPVVSEYAHFGARWGQAYLKTAVGAKAASGVRPATLRYQKNIAYLQVQHSLGTALTLQNPNGGIPASAVFSDESGSLTISAMSLATPTVIRFTFSRDVVGTLTLNHGQLALIGPSTQLSNSVAPISTTNGSPVVSVTWANHGRAIGDLVNIETYGSTLSVPATVGGLAIGGGRLVTGVPDANTIQITMPTNATSTATGGTSPQMVCRLMNQIMDNSAPNSDTQGSPLWPAVMTAVKPSSPASAMLMA